MRRFFLSGFLLLAGLGLPAFADDAYDACVEKGQTDMDWRECGSAWVERADAGLNAMWRELRAQSSDETKSALLDEQRAWIAYKDKSCMLWASGEYGTIGSVLYFPPCRARVIEARTGELSAYMDGLLEQTQ